MIEPLALPELDVEPPAGPDLEYDPAFLAMNLASVGTPESQFGSAVEAAVPPDWREVAAQATDLLGRTRDLRVLVQLATAHMNLHDLAGYAAALATIRVLIETTWDAVHPLLDPDEPEDTMVRSNALLDLKDGTKIMRVLRDLPLAAPPRMRAVTWRDIAVITGQMEAEAGRDRLSEAAVRGAFAATDGARLATLQDALETIVSELEAIRRAFDAKAGSGQGPDFDLLPRLVRDIKTEVARYAEMSRDAGEQPEGSGDGPGEETAEEGGRPARTGRGGRSFSSIRGIPALDSREDALHALSLASAYFRVNEPSSPLPLLIDRAGRLASMPFLDILRDLAPDGLLQAQTVVGTPTEE